MKKRTEDAKALREANRRMGSVMRLHHRLCERHLAKLPIHRAQHILLMRLAEEGALPSQRELADQMEISPAAVAVALKKLEAEGYIDRRTSQSDCRFNAISITEEGRRIVLESHRVFEALDERMYEGVSPEELFRFRETLDKIYKNLSTVREESLE